MATMGNESDGFRGDDLRVWDGVDGNSGELGDIGNCASSPCMGMGGDCGEKDGVWSDPIIPVFFQKSN